jgi:hypothetical protein
MALPPFDKGALKVTVAWVLPAVALTAVGTPGVVYGVTAFEAPEARLLPWAFAAVTVKVYAIPLVSPVTV